jgi:hypothetical protein
MTELYEIQDIETLPGMDADLSEKMMPEEALRFVSGNPKRSDLILMYLIMQQLMKYVS